MSGRHSPVRPVRGRLTPWSRMGQIRQRHPDRGRRYRAESERWMWRLPEHSWSLRPRSGSHSRSPSVDDSRPSPVPPATIGARRGAVHPAEVQEHAVRSTGDRSRALREFHDHGNADNISRQWDPQAPTGCSGHARRTLDSADEPGRAPPADQRAARRDVDGRAEASAGLRGRQVRSLAARTALGPPGNYRPLAGLRTQPSDVCGDVPGGYAVCPGMVLCNGPPHHPAHSVGDVRGTRRGAS